MGSSGVGFASKIAEDRPVLYVVKASWTDPSQRGFGLNGLAHVSFEKVVKYSGDRQQDFVTQVHEVASRVVTTLATAGTDAYGAAAVRVMDYTGTTKRALIEKRSLVAGAIVGAVRPVIQTTFLASGRDLAHRIGGNREGESKDDLNSAVKTLVSMESLDAALAAWAALLALE